VERTGSDYYTWGRSQAEIADQTIVYATKPGLPDLDDLVIPSRLLVEALQSDTPSRGALAEARSALDLNCGPGLVRVALSRLGLSVDSYDDNVVAVEAAKLTSTGNGLPTTSVFAGEPAADDQYDLAVLRAPKGRDVGRRLIALAARALTPRGRLFVAGANHAGVKSLIKDSEQILGPAALLGLKAGHRVVGFQRGPTVVVPPAYEDVIRYSERTLEVAGQTWRYVTRPGIFSWDCLDDGTRALIETARVTTGGALLDLGCGYGVVGLVAAQRAARVVSLDASASAVEATRRTYRLNNVPNAEVRLSDCASAVLGESFDDVLTNPPFHQGVETERSVAQQFIRDAHRVLSPSGNLWLVANRFLPYEREMQALFKAVRVAYEDNRYRVWHARKSSDHPPAMVLLHSGKQMSRGEWGKKRER